MLFHTITRDTKATRLEAVDNIPLGNSIRGLQHSGVRPQTVTLDAVELLYLLKNKEYAMTVLCALERKE